MFSVFQTGVSFITWIVTLLLSNVNFSEFSCSSGYFAFTNSLFMLPYFDSGRHQHLLGSPISYVICLALAALGVRWKSKCHLHLSFSDRERLLRGSCSFSFLLVFIQFIFVWDNYKLRVFGNNSTWCSLNFLACCLHFGLPELRV